MPPTTHLKWEQYYNGNLGWARPRLRHRARAPVHSVLVGFDATQDLMLPCTPLEWTWKTCSKVCSAFIRRVLLKPTNTEGLCGLGSPSSACTQKPNFQETESDLLRWSELQRGMGTTNPSRSIPDDEEHFFSLRNPNQPM